MLDDVSSGKKLPEKQLIVLGGTPLSQRDFLESLSFQETKATQGNRSHKKPPVANEFALGYTYHDVLDADLEDALARISVFLLSDPSPSFMPLLQPLLNPRTIPNTLIVILLDWAEPWFWIRQLQAWICLLRELLISLEPDTLKAMEDVMAMWRNKGRVGNIIENTDISPVSKDDLYLPLGSGEWEEALGVPLCVSDRVKLLEKERSWGEDEFDFILQFLRTILLKHGASLIYTTPSTINPLQSLIHSSLGIHSLLKPIPLKYNIVDRDKILVPPNWDSWGKIRILKDGFDIEAISNGWSIDIDIKHKVVLPGSVSNDDKEDDEQSASGQGAVYAYEKVIRDPALDTLQASVTDSVGLNLEVSSQNTQEFLASQLEVLEKMRINTTSSIPDRLHAASGTQLSLETTENIENHEEITRVREHIGPVQFNMGGIQVDADDMIQRLKDRRNHLPQDSSTPSILSNSSQNEALASFFEGLIHRGGNGSLNAPKTKNRNEEGDP
ncbi:dynein light intermediate chain [Blumeria hordei DH14]|uniref:Dynein light intermediate chain n=1 Tax=Blumeria graminis f. sp. hordei (strain DH14) TaxID=546991 RepID=N1JK48_BLUG1|nr:dynein light intermediate chain [Blumeria hordei DH14]